MSLQLVQAMSGYAMVAQATRMTLVAEALSFSEIPAASSAEVLQPSRALLQARKPSMRVPLPERTFRRLPLKSQELSKISHRPRRVINRVTLLLMPTARCFTRISVPLKKWRP